MAENEVQREAEAQKKNGRQKPQKELITPAGWGFYREPWSRSAKGHQRETTRGEVVSE